MASQESQLCWFSHTHVSDEDHPPVTDEIEKRLDLTVLFKGSPHIIRVRFVLQNDSPLVNLLVCDSKRAASPLCYE
jgi:hypothetical protein